MARNKLFSLVLKDRELIEILRFLVRLVVVVSSKCLHIVPNRRKRWNGTLICGCTRLCCTTRHHKRYIHTFCQYADLSDSSFFHDSSMNNPLPTKYDFLVCILFPSFRLGCRSFSCCRTAAYNSITQRVNNVSCDTSDKYTCPHCMVPSIPRKCRDTTVRRHHS